MDYFHKAFLTLLSITLIKHILLCKGFYRIFMVYYKNHVCVSNIKFLSPITRRWSKIHSPESPEYDWDHCIYILPFAPRVYSIFHIEPAVREIGLIPISAIFEQKCSLLRQSERQKALPQAFCMNRLTGVSDLDTGDAAACDLASISSSLCLPGTYRLLSDW